MAKKSNVKITVIKKLSWKEMGDKQLPDVAEGVADYCEMLPEGKEFIIGDKFEMPEGFCNWAWHDIYPEVMTLRFGGSFPWIKKEGMIYSSCSDGVRPVIFKLERIE